MAKVVAKRAAYFWALSADGLSRRHLALNLAFVLPLWICGALGTLYLVTVRGPSGSELFLVSVVLLYWVFHALTMVDFDFRYRIVVYPFILLVTAAALGHRGGSGDSAPGPRRVSSDA
jgi:hypothetical protein